MKYRDPETGEVFEDLERAHIWFCSNNGKRCKDCPISVDGVAYGCVSYRNDNPAEAARLMGMEVAEP